jgi:hypothetical protein
VLDRSEKDRPAAQSRPTQSKPAIIVFVLNDGMNDGMFVLALFESDRRITSLNIQSFS